ncbi:hypothetical protein PLESTF_000985300 [Pleodorina starrii]|nr:hypothetical protein PLESTF_000985300 [Pleodorina starrii]
MRTIHRIKRAAGGLGSREQRLLLLHLLLRLRAPVAGKRVASNHRIKLTDGGGDAAASRVRQQLWGTTIAGGAVSPAATRQPGRRTVRAAGVSAAGRCTAAHAHPPTIAIARISDKLTAGMAAAMPLQVEFGKEQLDLV